MSDLSPEDTKMVAGVINRHGRYELADAIDDIYGRLSAVEAKTANLPPGLGGGGRPPQPEVDPEASAQETSPPTEGEEPGSEEGESSSAPESDPATIRERLEERMEG